MPRLLALVMTNLYTGITAAHMYTGEEFLADGIPCLGCRYETRS